ncbi:orotidine-5'-phosphate decarboxylase [Chloroflexota bacterium]
MNFIEKLLKAAAKNDSLVCVGLDPDPALMPADVSVLEFNKAIIDATAGLVCAYKLNFAFYEALGAAGYQALKASIDYIPDDMPIIGDAKRSDIGNTARAYARAIFDELGCDATTVNPYLGYDSIEPFIQYKDKGVFILCRTSNAGAADFQGLRLGDNGSTLFELVAQKAEQWNEHGNVGLVVGATYPQELKLIRQQHPDMPLLIPGVGAQGGDLEKAVRCGIDIGGQKAIINSSRQIIYASKGKDFAAAAAAATTQLRSDINGYRNK